MVNRYLNLLTVIAIVCVALLVTLLILAEPAAATEHGGYEIEQRAESLGGDSLAEARPGETIRFTIVVTNVGDITATNVIIQETFEQSNLSQPTVVEELRNVAWEPSGHQQLENGMFEWTLAEMTPGSSWGARFEAKVNPVTVSQLEGSAFEPIIQVTSARAEEAVVVEVPFRLDVKLPPDAITIDKTLENNQPSLGDDGLVTATLTLQNNSEGVTYQNLSARDRFVGGVELPNVQEISPLDPENASFRVFDEFVDWTVGELGPKESWSVTYRAKIIPVYGIENSQISTSAQGFIGQSAMAESTARMLEMQQPKLHLSRSPDKYRAEPGQAVAHTIVYEILGSSAASQVVLEDAYDRSVVDDVTFLKGNGRVDSDLGKVIWDLGIVQPGDSEDVQYELTLKPDLSVGITDVTNSASIRADGVTEVPPADIVTSISAPSLNIEYLSPESLSVDSSINPGSRLRLTIRFGNAENAASATVEQVQASFDNRVVELVENISDGGQPGDGTIVWNLENPRLEPGTVLSRTFEAQLVQNMAEIGISKADFGAQISAVGGIVKDTSTNVPVQLPSPTVASAAPSSQTAAVESSNFTVIALLMALLIIGSLLALSWQARNLQMEGITSQESRDVIEMFTILVIVGAVLILAMVSSFDPQAAITVLSGIAGYVLGRGASK